MIRPSFDPPHPTKPLEFFEPMLRRVFSRTQGHMELNETREDVPKDKDQTGT
ncbi:hypothetical protein [Aliiroseovarius crassostreae]|uniref:hypothetical protein n=1 Tax=Aliiroseovarius crassostreae TaxID=154981 RepID=UPI001910F772|nr:hypothetical protein [Aliiroseovarius crassostreae]